MDDIAINGRDMIRISKFLKMSGSEFKKKYVRKPVSKIGLGWCSLNVPCPFLKDNKCQIYLVRPSVCVLYPIFHGRMEVDETGRMNRITYCSQLVNAQEYVNEHPSETGEKVYVFMDKFSRDIR